MFNATNVRLDSAMITMINIFRKMFGDEFLAKYTVIQFSRWSHGKKERRKDGRTMEDVESKLNERLRSEEKCIWIFF